MANYTWISDIEGNWTTTSNWNTDDPTPTYPSTGDAAIFNGDHTGNCLVDAIISVDSVTSSGTYTGNLILNNQLSVVGTAGFSWTSGILSGDATLEVYRDCNLIGSTISTGPSQLISILHNQSTANTLTANQTLSNLQLSRLVYGAENYNFSGNFNIAGDLKLYFIKIGGTATVTVQGDMYIDGDNNRNLNSSNVTITVNGDLNMISGSIEAGIIKLDGDMIVSDTWNGGRGIIEWQKVGNETWSPNSNVMYPTLKFTSARTVTLASNLYCYNLYISAGAELNLNNYTLRFQTLDVSNILGTLNVGSSELHFSPILTNAIPCNLGTMTVNVLRITNGYSTISTHPLRGNCNIGTLIVDMPSHLSFDSGTPTVTSEMQLINAYLNSGTINLNGNLTIANGMNRGSGGNGIINWTQPGDIVWSNTGGSTALIPRINFNSNRTVTLGDHLVAWGITLSNGILDVSSNNYSIESRRYWDSSACSISNPGLNARQGKVTLRLHNILTSLYGSNDSYGCVFYDLDILGGAVGVQHTFYGYFNVSNNVNLNTEGTMQMENNFVLNVAGDVYISDLSSLRLLCTGGDNPYWDIAGNLIIDNVDWNTISGSIKIYVEKDVTINNMGNYNSDYAYIILDGASDQYFEAAATAILTNYLQVNKSSGTAFLNSNGAYFQNLDIIQGEAKLANTSSTYNFKNGKTVTVYNGANLIFEGTSLFDKVTLREVSDGFWNIDNQPGSNVSAHFADIKNSIVNNPSAYAYYSTDSGGNTNWIFVTPEGRKTAIDNRLIDRKK